MGNTLVALERVPGQTAMALFGRVEACGTEIIRVTQLTDACRLVFLLHHEIAWVAPVAGLRVVAGGALAEASLARQAVIHVVAHIADAASGEILLAPDAASPYAAGFTKPACVVGNESVELRARIAVLLLIAADINLASVGLGDEFVPGETTQAVGWFVFVASEAGVVADQIA